MEKELLESGLDYAIESFKSIIGPNVRHFGQIGRAERGVSDGNEGVQWHTGVDMDRERFWFGVNLEGKKYEYWPIAVFIENELNASKLLGIAPTLEGGARIKVCFYRDAWQVTARPLIKEGVIGEVKLCELTDEKWKQMLTEARKCLDRNKNHIARKVRSVTLMKSGERKMEISPHLIIRVWSSVPASRNKAESFIKDGIKLLSPIYNIVKEQSSQETYL